jgi:hypothetical protein
MMRRADGEPILPGDVMPRGMCQPPVNTAQLIETLDLEELRRVMRTMAIWVPEVFELGLQRVSEDRERRAAYHRRQPA